MASLSLARQPTRSSLKITNRSFRYAAPSPYNEIPAELREPRQIQSPSPYMLSHMAVHVPHNFHQLHYTTFIFSRFLVFLLFSAFYV